LNNIYIWEDIPFTATDPRTSMKASDSAGLFFMNEFSRLSCLNESSRQSGKVQIKQE